MSDDQLIEIYYYPLDTEGNDISTQEPHLPTEGRGYQVPAPGDFLNAGGKTWVVLSRRWTAPTLQMFGTKQGKQAVTLYITEADADAPRLAVRQGSVS